VVDKEDTHPAVNEPFVKLLYAWLVDWPREIALDWSESVETVIVEPVKVEKAARFILMDDPTVIDEALTVGKE
jgi:hypothetical protein